MVVLFKKLHKSKELKQNEQDEPIEESEEQLEERLQKKLKSNTRRYRIKRWLTMILMVLVSIGGFKSLISRDKPSASALAVNDYAFVEEYLQNYFRYPKETIENEFLTKFTIDEGWKVDYGFDTVKSAELKGVDIYFVKQNTDGSISYYVKNVLEMKDKEDKDIPEEFDLKITVAQKNGGYLVIKPLEMVYTQSIPMSDEDKKDYKNNHSTSSGTDCNETEKEELKNTVDLFLKTYVSDYSQARLLLQDPSKLDPVSPATKISVQNVVSARKTDKSYLVDVNVIIETGEILKQSRTYHFEIDKNTNKILEMEEY